MFTEANADVVWRVTAALFFGISLFGPHQFVHENRWWRWGDAAFLVLLFGPAFFGAQGLTVLALSLPIGAIFFRRSIYYWGVVGAYAIGIISSTLAPATWVVHAAYALTFLAGLAIGFYVRRNNSRSIKV